MFNRQEATRREYERRIEKAKRFIALHLMEEFTLADVAAEAAFSNFHFHRIFTALTGETLAHHIRRLRLEKAANRLQRDKVSTITTIGMECGFSSPTVFSRAFKELFAITPLDFRNGARLKSAITKPLRAGKPYRLSAIQGTAVIAFPPERLFILTRVGPYDHSLVQFYRNVERLTRFIRSPGSFQMIGIALDNPHITPPNLCRYELGVPVPDSGHVSLDGEIRQFSPGDTAVYPFEARPFEVEKGFDDLYAHWLPESGYQPNDAPAFLVHRDDQFFSNLRRKTHIDICLPVISMEPPVMRGKPFRK